jgi:hypothetical protein
MKFQQLPLGARFQYEGKAYTKAGPMTATTEQGGQRIIPRFAVLQPLEGEAPVVAPAPKRKWDESVVLAAFEVFHGDCLRLLEETGVDEARGRILSERLESARQRFMAALR